MFGWPTRKKHERPGSPTCSHLSLSPQFSRHPAPIWHSGMSHSWQDLLVAGCACVGVASMVVGARATCKLALMLLNHCDGDTRAAVLNPSAYKGKTVWITGASSGLGKELAMQVGQLGAKVILSARGVEAMEAVKAELVAAGFHDVAILPVDLSNLDVLPEVAQRAIACFGGVDVFINNAGFTQRDIAANTEFAVDVHMINVDFLAGVCLTKALLPSMAARGGGRLINVTSLAGKVGIPLRTAYCGAKHAMQGFFDALRAEEAARGSGIGVTNVCPGSVRTNVAKNAITNKVGKLRGQTDVNIEAGLNPRWVCERILAAACSDVDEMWVANAKEMLLVCLSQYVPNFAKRRLRKAAKDMIAQTLADAQ